MLAAADTPERRAAALRQIAQLAERVGLTPDELGVSENMTEDERYIYGRGDMTVNQQEALPRTDRRLDQTDRRIDITESQGAQRIAIARKNADTAYQRMLRSGRSGSRPRADTELEYFRALENVPASQRSAEENAWVKDYLGDAAPRGPSGGGTRRPTGGPPSRAKPRVLRARPAN